MIENSMLAAAYNPDAPIVDQTMGPPPAHGLSGSRFNSLDSRVGSTIVGAQVTEALAEFKAGRFTFENLKALAFGMGWQVVEGKDTQVLVAKIADLEKQIGELTSRATQAESAFASARAELDAAKHAKPRKGTKE